MPGADVVIYPFRGEAEVGYLADWMNREVSPEGAARIRKFLKPIREF